MEPAEALQTACLKSTASKPADWSVGVAGDQAVVSSLWPLSHFIRSPITSHVQHSHMSARPAPTLSAGHMCRNSSPSSHQKEPACFSSALWRRALKPLGCRIVAHKLHDVSFIWTAPQLGLFQHADTDKPKILTSVANYCWQHHDSTVKCYMFAKLSGFNQDLSVPQ